MPSGVCIYRPVKRQCCWMLLVLKSPHKHTNTVAGLFLTGVESLVWFDHISKEELTHHLLPQQQNLNSNTVKRPHTARSYNTSAMCTVVCLLESLVGEELKEFMTQGAFLCQFIHGIRVRLHSCLHFYATVKF